MRRAGRSSPSTGPEVKDKPKSGAAVAPRSSDLVSADHDSDEEAAIAAPSSSAEFEAQFRRQFGMGLSEISDLAQVNTERKNARLAEEMADFFNRIDIEALADVLDKMIKGSTKFENLTEIKVGSKLLAMLNSARKIFDVANRAWNKELEEYWDSAHKMLQLREPLVKSENSIANTTLIRIIRFMLIIMFEDSSFYTDPTHSCFDPAEVKKDKMKGNPEPHRIDAEYFSIFKFMRKKETQYVELGKQYDSMVTLIMNYARENIRDRKSIRSADYIFIYEVLERLSAIMQDVELNKNKMELLAKIGKLIAFVKLANRIGLFSQVRWPWTVDFPQEIEFNGEGKVKVSGSLKMSQLLVQLDLSLTRILYEVQSIIDDRSVYKHAARLTATGARLGFFRKDIYRHFASSLPFADADTYRDCAREDAIRGAAGHNSALALVVRDEKALARKLKEPVFIVPQTALLQKAAGTVVLGSQDIIDLSGIGAYAEDVQNLIRKYNPAAFTDPSHFAQFSKDMLTIFQARIPSMKHPKLARFLEEQATDYATVITLTHKLELILVTVGQIVEKLSRNSGEIELCLSYKKEMLDVCAAMYDIYNMIMPILTRMEKRPDSIGQEAAKVGLMSLIQDNTYRTLFCGSGLELIREIKKTCATVNSDIQAFSNCLNLFDKSKFAAIVVEQIQGGHDLANMGFHVGKVLQFCGHITKTSESALAFPMSSHQECKTLSCDTPFVQRQAQWWGTILAQESATPALPASPAPLAIAGPAAVSKEEDKAEIARLKEEVSRLKKQVLAYHTPRLEANYYHMVGAEFFRMNADEYQRACEALDEKAKLRFELRMLNYILAAASKKIAELSSGKSKKSVVEVMEELKVECREAAGKGELEEASIVYSMLQAKQEAVKVQAQSLQAVSNGAAYFGLALAISAKLRAILKKGFFEIADLVEAKVALEQHEIEAELLRGPAPVVAPVASVNNNNNAPSVPDRKALPTAEMAALVEELGNVKMLFRQLSDRILNVYSELWIAPAPAAIRSSTKLPSMLFNRSSPSNKSPSPESLSAEEIAKLQSKKAVFVDSLCSGFLSFANLYNGFLEEFSKGEFCLALLKSSVQKIVLAFVFQPLFLDLAEYNDPFMANVCGALLLELSPLLAPGDKQCLTIAEHDLEDFRRQFAAAGGALKFAWDEGKFPWVFSQVNPSLPERTAVGSFQRF